MSPIQIAITAVVLLAVLALAMTAWSVLRRRSLRQRFGSEYDLAIQEQDSRPAAERELRDRQRRHSALELTELSPAARARYTARWQDLQVQFIDAPRRAVNKADDLVTQLIAECGYPTDNHDEQLAQLSVDHASTLGAYREAHEINVSNRRGEATTEQLRLAVVHYRAIVADLLGEQPTPPSPDDAQPAAVPHS